MKCVTIKLLGVGMSNYFSPEVYIYDEFACLVYSGYACNGEVQTMLCSNKCYRVLVKSCLVETSAIIYVGNNNTYPINVGACCQNNNLVTFTLSDVNYSNLPITEGQVILWQR